MCRVYTPFFGFSAYSPLKRLPKGFLFLFPWSRKCAATLADEVVNSSACYFLESSSLDIVLSVKEKLQMKIARLYLFKAFQVIIIFFELCPNYYFNGHCKFDELSISTYMNMLPFKSPRLFQCYRNVQTRGGSYNRLSCTLATTLLTTEGS